MKIEVMSMWYNDAALAPFFLKHYSYADRISIILDSETEDFDECVEQILKYPKANIERWGFSKGYSIDERQNLIFRYCNLSESDWIIVPDSDEFIFCDNMHEFLSRQTADIVRVRFYQVFRNILDKDLDPNLPVKEQRKHGDPDYVKGNNGHQTKPIILRPRKRIHLMPGNHGIYNLHKHKVSEEKLTGAHWQMADPALAVPRRLSRKKRFSMVDIPSHYATHDRTITEEEIINECNKHLYDKEVPL